MELEPLLPILPLTAQVNTSGHLVLGGCDTVELAHRFGTPLYVLDELTMRTMCRQFRHEFRSRHPDTTIIYACKAYIGLAMASLVAQEDLGADVVSGGELAFLITVGFSPEKIYFHGNNKSPQELEEALRYQVGRVVVDNFYELELLERVAAQLGRRQPVLLRISPGVDPHTHAKTTTGTVESKFGIPIADGQAREAVAKAGSSEHLELVGLHFHLGSPIFDVAPYQEAIRITIGFAADALGPRFQELGVGGGFAAQYVPQQPPPSISAYAEAIVHALKEECRRYRIPTPRLVVEPGRAIVARAGVALYTVGAWKAVPGGKRYISVDGGMGDNIRPALYGAQYVALLANRLLEPATERVTVAGKFCESGDVLVWDAHLPSPRPGDLLAIPAAGAYTLAMASNYNASLRPAVVMVKDGEARLVRRRETYKDLLQCEVWP